MKIQTTYPDHQSGATIGTVGYGITQCSYDAINRRSICTDQAGDTQTFNYDLAGRLLSKDYRTAANSPSGAIADTDSFTYDRSSRMLTATSGRYNNVCGMTYDSAGRKKTESLTVGGQTYTTTVGYDVASRQNQMIYPDGTILNRSYTDRHQLEQLTYDGNVVDTRAYDDGGRLTSCTLGNGIVDSRTYNNDNTLASISSTNADIGTYSYTWDENKNKTSETITGPLADYSFTTGPTGYDTEDRLTEYTRGTLNQQWDLSLEGDWNTFTENGVTRNRTHGPTHEVNIVGAAAVTHDVKGNVTIKPSSLNPVDTSTLTWDFDNRLTSVDTDSNGTTEATYTYDATGRRVTKNNTVFACFGQQVMAEYVLGTAATSSTEQYVYGSYIDEPVVKSDTNGLLFYHRNQQYSIIGITDAVGNVTECYVYSAYGRLMILDSTDSEIPKSTISNPYTFTARRYESDTGDYFFRARYYNCEHGRFLGRDRTGYGDGRNLYAAYFSPNEIDPSGNCVVSDKACTDCWKKGIKGFRNNLKPDGELPEGADKSLRNIIQLMTEKFLFGRRWKKGCKPDLKCCGSTKGKRCENCARGLFGKLTTGTQKITICANQIDKLIGPSKGCKKYWETMRHELVHLKDQCLKTDRDKNLNECELCLCDEVRSYFYSGQCKRGSHWWNYYAARGEPFASEKHCLFRGSKGSCDSKCAFVGKSTRDTIQIFQDGIMNCDFPEPLSEIVR